MTQQIRHQLARSEGLVGYTLRTDLSRRTFWTVSAWETERFLDEFVVDNPHVGIMRTLNGSMELTRFDTFTAAGHEIPIKPDEAIARVRSA